jgi:hypothetical protein
VYSFNSCSAEVVTAKILRDFRLPPQCRWDLHSSGILRSVEQ